MLLLRTEMQDHQVRRDCQSAVAQQQGFQRSVSRDCEGVVWHARRYSDRWRGCSAGLMVSRRLCVVTQTDFKRCWCFRFRNSTLTDGSVRQQAASARLVSWRLRRLGAAQSSRPLGRRQSLCFQRLIPNDGMRPRRTEFSGPQIREESRNQAPPSGRKRRNQRHPVFQQL